MIYTYFKLCVLELSEKNAARQGGGGGNSFTLYILAAILSPCTYIFYWHWVGGGRGSVSAQILRERTAVVLGAILRFSALFQERTAVFFRVIERWANLKICKMSARAIAILGKKMSAERRANLKKKSECPALLNGQSHKIFWIRLFSLISSSWPHWRCPWAVLIFSNFSRSYWTFKMSWPKILVLGKIFKHE